jgi:hypothetical protein
VPSIAFSFAGGDPRRHRKLDEQVEVLVPLLRHLTSSGRFLRTRSSTSTFPAARDEIMGVRLTRSAMRA